jgi:coenzyme F420 hydrogenase subunit beta
MCAGCGACVLICPYDRLELVHGIPEQRSGEKSVCSISEEGKCGLCAHVCPRFSTDLQSLDYIKMAAGRSTDTDFQEYGQDCGLVSSIAAWGLKTGSWKRALVYSRDSQWRVHPVIAKDREGVLRAAGSKYTYLPLVEGLREIYRQGKEAGLFAIVGLPCHIAGIRKLQQINSKYVRNVALCIGLFCTKAFTYEGLIKEKLKKEMNLPITDVEKMDIRKGMFTVERKGGEVYKLPIKELGAYSHTGCALCTDFAAEQADISVGGLGIGGWAIAQLRTETGEKIFEKARNDKAIETAKAEDFPKALEVLNKLSNFKRKNAEKQ